MGVLDWFFPSPEGRIARAREAIGRRRFRDARDLLTDLEHADAPDLLCAAENGLVELNLEAAVRSAHGGDAQRVQDHFELAESFHRGGLEERFRQTRGDIRRIFETRQPVGVAPRMDLPEDGEERRMRLSLHFENYPPELRGGVVSLGPQFGEAVLHLDDGRPDLAWPILHEFPSDSPLASYERARAAFALGDPVAAESNLREFGRIVGGYRRIGLEHTGLFLAQTRIAQRDAEGAVRVLRDVRATEPLEGGFLLAQLLLATGSDPPVHDRLAEAEHLVRELVLRTAKEPALYLLLAKIRLAGGERLAAIRALEQSLASCCDAPGKCGNRPPDPTTLEMLARLYTEEGIDSARAEELLAKADVLKGSFTD